MRNAETLGIQPSAPDADHPVLIPVAQLTVKSTTDLAELSRRLGMGWKEFQAYNPQFLRAISPAGRTSTVYVPKNKEALARQILKGTLSGAGWRYYKVARGDTLAKVSSRTGVPASVISQLNPGRLKSGQQLRLPVNVRSLPDVIPAVPVRNATAVASASRASTKRDHASSAVAELRSSRSVPSSYKVRSGDTLSAIAHKYGVGLGDIYAANGGADKLRTLRVGQVIRLSSPVKAVAQKSSSPSASSKKLSSHTVKSGETAYAISRRYGISFDELCAVNGGKDVLSRLSPGQVLKIPSGERTVVAQKSSGTSKTSASAAPKVAEYSVQSGETLWSISRKFNMKPMELLALNGMDQSTRIKVGDTVKVIRNK